MNAIISLCHFCEIHGPSVLFCTQAFHAENSPQQIIEHDQNCSASLTDSGSYYIPQRLQSPSTPTGGGDQATHKLSGSCEACRSLPTGHSGYISNDHEDKVSYVSSQHPAQQQVFSMVRQACVRSLSCEVCPGREGPIFFGDDQNGHVLSYTFYLKDTQARGLQRWYSIIVVMMDKIFLLNSWPFLVSCMKKVIDRLQEKASKVYDKEEAKCPPRVQRLSLSKMSMTAAEFLKQKGGGGSKSVRPLIELTNDKNLFKNIHMSFTWILKAGGSRMTEKLLEGPPTEDSIIDLEKQEETEEGFTMVYTKKLDSLPSVAGAGVDSGPESPVDQNPGAPTFKNLRHLLKVIGTLKFHTLAYNVVIGNQIIIRGNAKAMVKSVIDCLKALLPKGCCRVISYSNEYEDSWRCNFLGLSPKVILPKHIEESDLYAMLDIKGPEITKDAQPDWDDFVGYHFELTTAAALPERVPTVLSKMEKAILNDSLKYTVVEQCLVCHKEEWMNKVKVVFKFTKAEGPRSEEETRRLLQVLGAQEEDKQVLKFWMTGLSVQYRTHMLSTSKGHLAD